MIKSQEIINRLNKEKFLPLYTVTNLKYLDKLEEILIKNDISLIEITYRSDKASEAIKYLSNSKKLIVGAGTVRDLDTAKEAIENGAQFIVTPGVSEEVLEYCQRNNILVFPGIATPTDIITAMNYGIRQVKFFPANIYGGLSAIKALSGPFFDIEFIPTGGVNKENFKEYLSDDSVMAVGGSFIISENLIAKDNGVTAEENLKEIIAKI